MLAFKTLLLALQTYYPESVDGPILGLFDVGTDFDYPEGEAFFEIGSVMPYPASSLVFSVDSDSTYPGTTITFNVTSLPETDILFGELEISSNTNTEDLQIPKIGIQIGSVD